MPIPNLPSPHLTSEENVFGEVEDGAEDCAESGAQSKDHDADYENDAGCPPKIESRGAENESCGVKCKKSAGADSEFEGRNNESDAGSADAADDAADANAADANVVVRSKEDVGKDYASRGIAGSVLHASV